MPVFRYHRGGLKESMETCVVVNNKEELAIELSKLKNYTFTIIMPEDLIIKPYVFDKRIGWNTHIVLVNPRCVTMDVYPIGFLSDSFCSCGFRSDLTTGVDHQ